MRWMWIHDLPFTGVLVDRFSYASLSMKRDGFNSRTPRQFFSDDLAFKYIAMVSYCWVCPSWSKAGVCKTLTSETSLVQIQPQQPISLTGKFVQNPLPVRCVMSYGINRG